MGILRSLFGNKDSPSTGAKQPAPDNPRDDPNLIRVFDKYGREIYISKDDWRRSVLPDAIKKNWNDAEQLYNLIVGTLRDGFRADIVAATKHLFQIDTDRVRGACLWGIVLMEEGRLSEAEQVLREHCKRHGEDGYVLTNLAKIRAKREDQAGADALLWRALELDPNQENALEWYVALQRERGGESERVAALRKVAAVDGSWRAQLWIARAALQAGDLGEALRLYEECLARTPRPAPPDVLMQISGDLGNAGHLQHALNLVEPVFDVETHGLEVGNNLIKAHTDLGHLDDARRVLDRLYALKRPDWQETLSYWDTEIAKARISSESSSVPTELQLILLEDVGPVWLKPESPAAALFPAKATDCAIVSFLGSTAEVARKVEKVEPQLADAPGRLSRALPLFFAEQISLGTDARARTLIPWVASNGGFVLFGNRWKDADALTYVSRNARSDFAVVSNVDARTDHWTVDVHVLRVRDGQLLGEISETFPVTAPTESIKRLGRQLRELLCRAGNVHALSMPTTYSLPPDAHFPVYLIRLEQLLAVRCSSMDGVPVRFLSGERDIIAGMVDLCLQAPSSVSARLLLAQTLLAMKRVRANVVAEFRDRVQSLQKEHPLPAPAADVVQRSIDEATAGLTRRYGTCLS